MRSGITFKRNFHHSSMSTQAPTKSIHWRKAREGGAALFSLRRSIGINRETFARLANFSERTLATYEKEAALPATARAQITEALRLVQALLEIIPSEQLVEWLEAPNPGFNGKTPWSLIQHGERDLIWEMIYQTRHGAFA
jgi:DNA-binding transcriptional regulator YiaG